MTNDAWKVANIKSGIMAMMLNGTIPWVAGCTLRMNSDEDLIKEFGEAFDKDEASNQPV